MEILYFDNHIIVVNKPAGISTESTDGKSLESEVKLWGKETYGKSGDMFLRAAHRLDKAVSGIVVLAKTTKALQRLHEAFRQRNMQKTYVALIEGNVKDPSGLLEDYLVHEEFRAAVVSKDHPNAKQASLSYRLRKKTSLGALLEIDLHTGRYHQIRAQFSSRGHPIVNDLKYGARQVGDADAIALHHEKLEVPHPISKEVLVFKVDPPKYWEPWIL